ncbi:MAG: phosphopantetheine-binding protein [bacterium]|nr:phosphopantetheine-binding protein [bacterium]
MEKSEVQKCVVSIVAQVLREDQGVICLGDDLDDLGADSLDIAEIVSLLEETFPVTLRSLGWASSGRITVDQVTEDIYQLMGAPVVQVAT